ncbi:class I SAM-dependent methyltransferase [Natrialbaceae archaeon AArc-T1-2]|uniref:class I SAM-dependent methyltransferase n=1 Tax=Natrialbaceae archaeon AArc-T1-2 TaxID=3053904 RepID=UPI00255A911E|nr:methyltransferase domain-containing protein [Natrialbaceae archaeon AArc-T1-2]WIV67989.1 methyltransferase domain-containing protein [Natrialbaceae archaeon AArc-T1-2]
MNDQTRQSAGWQVEQSASEAYEQYLVQAIFAPWTDRLIEAGEIHEGDRVLDVACGTGIVARRAASWVGTSGSVVGLDINEGMLAVAEETAAEIQPSIEWRQGDATDLPFSNEEFDVVCCQQALQFFDDPGAAVGEIRRVLSPGGRVAMSVWRPLDYQPAYVVLADALKRHIGDEAGAMMRSPFPDWDMGYLRTLTGDAGFDDASVTIEIGSVRYPSVAEFIRREAASSPLAEPIAAVEQAVRNELVRDVENALDAYVDDEGIISPMESYVVIVDR